MIKKQIKGFLIAGARPNFMKIAPIYREALRHKGVDCKIVHTGQHYDYEMSQAFFEDLELPKPDFFLNGGSGSHAVDGGDKRLPEFGAAPHRNGHAPGFTAVLKDK